MQMSIFLGSPTESRDLALFRAILVNRDGARRRGGCFAFGFSFCETFSDGEDGIDDDGIDAF